MRKISRRELVMTSTATGVGLIMAGQLRAAPCRTALKKAMYIGEPREDTFKALKDAGFDGVEVRAGNTTPEQAASIRERAYIDAHNRSMDSAREHVKKLIPVAEETKVVIALENVWNNFCVKPSIFKWMVASFKSPWVKAYFDVGNHVK